MAIRRHHHQPRLAATFAATAPVSTATWQARRAAAGRNWADRVVATVAVRHTPSPHPKRTQ